MIEKKPKKWKELLENFEKADIEHYLR